MAGTTYIIGGDPVAEARERDSMARQVAEREQAYRQRVQTLTNLFLGLGEHTPAILADRKAVEAAASAAADHWNKLADLESQVLREKERLCSRVPSPPRPHRRRSSSRKTSEQRMRTGLPSSGSRARGRRSTS